MSLFEELQKGAKAQPRLWDYLRWAVLAVLMAVALVAVVILALLVISGESASEVIENLLHHIYIHYGLIPVIVLLVIAVVAVVAFVVQLAFTYIVYWKAYAEKRAGGQEDRPALLDAQNKKTGWTKGYYQGVVLIVTNLLIAVCVVAGIVYSLGYVGIGVAEQPAFCTMCHEVMDPPYQSYLASSHNGIHCGACHNDPGVKGFVKGEVIAPMKEGWLQVAEKYHLDEHGHLLPAAVPVNNESCLASECHKEKRLREEEFHYKGFVFRHDKHLDIKHGGEALTCDACHAYDHEIHMKVDNNTCGLCHFSKKNPIKEPSCEACHVTRMKLKDESRELMHRQSADFEQQPCNGCHAAMKSDLILLEEACGAKCHHRHGEDKKLEDMKGTEQVHEIHKHAACMSCHERAHHKIDHSKFTQLKMEPFGKKFTHENHTQDCHECHARKDGRFSLTLKDKFDCSKCHHEGIDDVESCDSCHDIYKPKAFGKDFNHKTHGESCNTCHNENLRLKLKGRADCNACHHEGADDPEMCMGCHDTQDSFYKGSGEYGIEEMPSIKADAEMGCDTCHADMPKYNPASSKQTCLDCHEGAGDDYDYDKLLANGKKALDNIDTLIASVREKLIIKQKSSPDSELVKTAEKWLGRAEGIAALMRKDGSFGIHNPGQFQAYVQKATELLISAKNSLEE